MAASRARQTVDSTVPISAISAPDHTSVSPGLVLTSTTTTGVAATAPGGTMATRP